MKDFELTDTEKTRLLGVKVYWLIKHVPLLTPLTQMVLEDMVHKAVSEREQDV